MQNESGNCSITKFLLLSTYSQAKYKTKPCARLISAATTLASPELNGGEHGPLPCCFSAAQLPVTARTGKRKPAVSWPAPAPLCRAPHQQVSASPKPLSPPAQHQCQGLCKAAVSNVRLKDLRQDPVQSHSYKVPALCLGRGLDTP